MAKAELGTKRICVSCATRFYDLAKVPAVCIKCGTEQPLDQPRVRRAAGNVVDEKRVKKVPVADLDGAEAEAEPAEDDAEEDVLEDASELEDDADVADIEVEPEADEKEQ